MSRIAESELIINTRGAVYHLDLRPEEIAGTIITVGDPDRVKEVSKHFDSIEFKRQHREFITHTGYIGKKRLPLFLQASVLIISISYSMNWMHWSILILTTRQVK